MRPIRKTIDDQPESPTPRRGSASRQRSQPRSEPGLAVGPSPDAADQIEEGDTQFVTAVARALAVLNAFRPGDDALGNAELAERTSLPKPTISRLTYTLARCGYLDFSPRHRLYTLGVGVAALGNVALAAMDVRKLARPLMADLARRSTFNVGLGTRDNHLMIYTDASEGEALVGLRLYAGSRIPIMTSAMGRAYLAALPEAERAQLMSELKPLYGAEWHSLQGSMMQALRDLHTYGYCVSVGEWQKDIHGVAAPILSASGRIFAVNLGGPAHLLPEEVLRKELGPRVCEIARSVETAMKPTAIPIPRSIV